MKKKFIFAVLITFMCAFINVNAEVPKVNTNFIGRAPAKITSNTAVMSSITDETFDYSKITFSKASGDGTITGRTDVRKIVLIANSTGIKIMGGISENFTTGGTKSFESIVMENLTDDNWFTGYCLDSYVKYPLLSIMNYPNVQTYFAPGANTQDQLDMFVNAAFFNDVKHYDLFKSIDKEIFAPVISYELGEGFANADAAVTAILAQQPVSVNIKSVTINTMDMDTYEFKPNSSGVLTSNLSETDDYNYVYSFNVSNIFYDKYSASKGNFADRSNYKKAQWIAQNTYPTYSLEEALALAGVNVQNLLLEIGTLESITPSVEDTNFMAFVENYVYATVQYAIWNVVGKDNLGNTLNGSTELNKLYQYLVTNASEEIESEYTENFTLVEPTNALKEQSKDYYVYGPYKVTHNLMSAGTIKLGILNSNKTGISIVDKDGNEIDTVEANTEFYIKTKKDAKVATVKLKIFTENGRTMTQDATAKVFYANNALAQNLVSPAYVKTGLIETKVDLNYNPKTGVENIAIIFVITIIAFSLGYLALSYKNKPIELN